MGGIICVVFQTNDAVGFLFNWVFFVPLIGNTALASSSYSPSLSHWFLLHAQPGAGGSQRVRLGLEARALERNLEHILRLEIETRAAVWPGLEPTPQIGLQR